VHRQEDRKDEAYRELVESWQTRFSRFKDQQKNTPGEVDASEAVGLSESADTVGRLPLIGGEKRRRGAASVSSGFSMTSSAVHRNEGLSTLDERYDQVSYSLFNI
jgi:protein LTV1